MDGYINMAEFAAASCGGRDWTAAFRKAVACLEERGGGTLFVPAGVYSTRSIQLKSFITLYLDNGAILDFKDDYENFSLVETEFEGSTEMMYMPLLFADQEQQIYIKGSGCINGNGERAWEDKERLPFKRPYMICFQHCKGVRVEGVTLKNSPVWTVHPLYCDNVAIHGITILNPSNSPNTDGINPDGCRNVRISDCYIDVGDDCIAIKSGTELTPKRSCCENITITNCIMVHGHGGIVIGSEMSGDIRNVAVSNCVFQNTDRGIRIKTRRQRGGIVEMLSFSNITMDHVLCPFIINMYYCCGTSEEDGHVWEKVPYPVNDGTPLIRDIHVNNITAVQVSSAAGFIYGLAEQPVLNVTLSNCSIRMDTDAKAAVPDMLAGITAMKAAGFFLRNARNISFCNVRIYNAAGDSINLDNTVELKMS
jgi:Endopolygalacturonase